jgi:hypothetical protein
LLATLLSCASGARAQTVVHNDENLASDRPEAWAMKYVAASSLMTAFGETPALAAWRWGLAVDLGYIPRLSQAQQRVGFNGIKQEDLNRSRVFGRLRLILGLPGDFVAELGYTPPLSIDGAQPLDLVALSIGRRIFERDSFTLSMQAFGQHGRAQGDVTCPARLAGVVDRQQNPFGCQRHPTTISSTITASRRRPRGHRIWHAHASLVPCALNSRCRWMLTFGVHDRSLRGRGSMPFATVGVSRDLMRNGTWVWKCCTSRCGCSDSPTLQ